MNKIYIVLQRMLYTNEIKHYVYTFGGKGGNQKLAQVLFESDPEAQTKFVTFVLD